MTDEMTPSESNKPANRRPHYIIHQYLLYSSSKCNFAFATQTLLLLSTLLCVFVHFYPPLSLSLFNVININCYTLNVILTYSRNNCIKPKSIHHSSYLSPSLSLSLFPFLPLSFFYKQMVYHM